MRIPRSLGVPGGKSIIHSLLCWSVEPNVHARTITFTVCCASIKRDNFVTLQLLLVRYNFITWQCHNHNTRIIHTQHNHNFSQHRMAMSLHGNVKYPPDITMKGIARSLVHSQTAHAQCAISLLQSFEELEQHIHCHHVCHSPVHLGVMSSR